MDEIWLVASRVAQSCNAKRKTYMVENGVRRPLYKAVYEITHGTEMADEKFHFYFLTKAKCIFKD